MSVHWSKLNGSTTDSPGDPGDPRDRTGGNASFDDAQRMVCRGPQWCWRTTRGAFPVAPRARWNRELWNGVPVNKTMVTVGWTKHDVENPWVSENCLQMVRSKTSTLVYGYIIMGLSGLTMDHQEYRVDWDYHSNIMEYFMGLSWNGPQNYPKN